ncbi:hypothetical protein GCM10022225_02960 [Plantactinospora mayteni]|uniref:DUF3618 domain-containing protein n=1 Tax=Plantactinospora mayteni TaxID=566021 RepID=A0ABQ4EQ82_9ACTN|nr:hypothetical protein [Plantactinospora mayteni]GIG96784.1 hypothetical protein Pma05_33570 [Plantactinospora mayteni]
MARVSVGDVVAQFRAVLGIVDEAAIGAARAQREAEQTQAAYAEVSQGTADRLMRKAVVDSRTAAEKAGKTARLLSEAAEHFTTYVNIIAPGTVPPRSSAPEAIPEGERVVSDAMARRKRATGFLDRAARRADDVKDSVASATKAVEEGTKIALKQIKGDRPPTGGAPSSTTTTSTPQPAPAQSPPAHEAVSALVVTALGAALVGRAGIDYIKKRLNRRNQDGDQK